jgi:hypothetical protein
VSTAGAREFGRQHVDVLNLGLGREQLAGSLEQR